MKNVKRNSSFAIYIAFLTFVLFASLVAFYIFLPAFRDINSLNDIYHTPDSWPYLPRWAILVIGTLPIAATLWMIGVLIKIRTHIVSPLVKTDAFLEELANNNIPPPLHLKQKYGQYTNHMLTNLNSIRDRIVNSNRQKDAIQTRESAARAKLDYANELKSLIISRLTPDIRMPLNSIEGFAEIIKAKTQDDFKDELDGIARNIAGISKIVSRIISFSKIGHQQMEITPNYFRTADLIENLLKSNDDLLQEREVDIVNIFNSTTPELLYTDYELLAQTLLLVIRAVFRASEHGECISLCCSMDDEKVYFTVKDSGRSACREKLAELFNFHEFDCSAEYLDDASSTLLGIFFASSLVNYIGGELTAFSNDDANNKFVLTFNKFDILAAETEEELRKKGIQDNLTPASSSNLVVGKNYLSGSFAAPSSQTSDTVRKILLGEDNADNAHALSEYLKLFNFEVICCDNAPKLLQLSQDGTFDAIILSNSMRHRHLVEVIKTIRSQFNAARLPIIVLVTKLNPRKEAELQTLKVSSILLKPIRFASLVDRLNQLCSFQD
ncbi:MAG: hybrid sensor histidine kinase/response regulator [Lentisphaeria bacterium]|nr:hybrid sensor histidine kinase/response regulator [Lentisphaeria bacterium]